MYKSSFPSYKITCEGDDDDIDHEIGYFWQHFPVGNINLCNKTIVGLSGEF